MPEPPFLILSGPRRQSPSFGPAGPALFYKAGAVRMRPAQNLCLRLRFFVRLSAVIGTKFVICPFGQIPAQSCPFCPCCGLDDTGQILSPTASGRRGAPGPFPARAESIRPAQISASGSDFARHQARPPLAAIGTKFVTSFYRSPKRSCPFYPSCDLDDTRQILFR